MAHRVDVEFNPKFFDDVMKSAGVNRLLREKAEEVLHTAKAAAPVDTGAYRDSLKIKIKHAHHRRVYRVVGADQKTLLVEAKTGNLARALRSVMRGRR